MLMLHNKVPIPNIWFVTIDIEIDEIANIYNGRRCYLSFHYGGGCGHGSRSALLTGSCELCWRSLTGSCELGNWCLWYHILRADRQRLLIPTFRLAVAVERENGETYQCKGFCRRSSFSSFCTALSVTGFSLLFLTLPISIERRRLRRSTSFAKALNQRLGQFWWQPGPSRGLTQYTTVS